jgi:membrane associated rhomboid family serine protease
MLSHLTRLILVSATLAAAGAAGSVATAKAGGVAACASGAWTGLLGSSAQAGRCAP